MKKKYYKLDYSITSPEERIVYVKSLLAAETAEKVSRTQLEYLANYILAALPPEEKKKKKILTDNRISYIKNYRETSYEGLALTFEAGEDGIINIATTNPHQYLTPRKKLSVEECKKDVQLAKIQQSIEELEQALATAQGYEAYRIKQNIIELNQMKYIVNDFQHPPVRAQKAAPIEFRKTSYPLAETIEVTQNGDVIEVKEGVSITQPNHVAAILSLYEELKAEGDKSVNNDLHYLMEEFDKVFQVIYKEKNPEHYQIAMMKIKGMTNKQIQEQLKADTGVTHTYEHLSTLWTTKIPKEIADIATDEYIYWYYTTQKPGIFKKCSKCGQIKLMNSRFFSKNKTSKDGYYSQCKECRNAAAREKLQKQREMKREQLKEGQVILCQNSE